MIQLFHITEDLKWDRIVMSFSNYDVYYLSGYVKSFKTHGDGDPILLYYERNGAKAMCVLMLRDVANDDRFAGLPKGKYFDAITPYGYGGIITEGHIDFNDLKKSFFEVLRNNHVNSVFCRFHPVLNNAGASQLILDVFELGKTIALDLSNPDIIWANITSKNRNMIRKAEKSGIEIHHSDDPALFKDFKDIYDKTMFDDRAEEYYFFNDEFYQSIARDLKGHYQIFYATMSEKIISIAIMIFANDQLHYHLSGSLREYRSFASSNLLLYKAALWGYEQGLKTFHLGGGVGSGEDSLYKFKASFNRNSNYRFAIGKSIVDYAVYNELLQFRGFSDEEISRISYFPQYRARI